MEGMPVIFDERRDGDYRIYAGVLEAPHGHGYIAALVVNRIGDDAGAPHETFRYDSLACGYRWLSPDEAWLYAMNTARSIIRRERLELDD
jgi:hypothetical protein